MYWQFQPALISGVLPVLISASIVAGPVSASAEENPAGGDGLTFSVRFWPDEIELSGAVCDRRTVNALVAEMACDPDFEIWDVDLEIDRRAAPLPPMDELSGLLMELALSTREGNLRIAPNSIVVSGLTDSLVTHAAFEARLKDLSAGRFVHSRNEIEVISAKELKLRIGRRPKLALDPQPLDFRPVEVSDEPYGPPGEMPRDETVDLAGNSISGEAGKKIDSSATTPPSSHPGALDVRLGPLAPIRFDANTFLVEFKQHDTVREAAELINALPATSRKVILRGYPDATGRSTYHQWLGLARAKQVRQLLVDFGVSEEKLGVEGVKAGPLRQVQIVIPGR